MNKVLFLVLLTQAVAVLANNFAHLSTEEESRIAAEIAAELSSELQAEETIDQSPYIVRYAVIPEHQKEDSGGPQFGQTDAVPTVLYQLNQQQAASPSIAYRPRPPSSQSVGNKQENQPEDGVRYILIRPGNYQPPQEGTQVFAIHQPDEAGDSGGGQPQVIRIHVPDPEESPSQHSGPQTEYRLLNRYPPSDYRPTPRPPPSEYKPSSHPPPPEYRPNSHPPRSEFRPNTRPPPSEYRPSSRPPPSDYRHHPRPSPPPSLHPPPSDYRPRPPQNSDYHRPGSRPHPSNYQSQQNIRHSQKPPHHYDGPSQDNSVKYDINAPGDKYFTLRDARPEGPSQYNSPSSQRPNARQVPLAPHPPPLQRPVTRIIIRRPAPPPPPPPKEISSGYKSTEEDDSESYHALQPYTAPPSPPRRIYPTPKYHPTLPPRSHSLNHDDDDDEDIDDIVDHRATPPPTYYSNPPPTRAVQYTIPTKSPHTGERYTPYHPPPSRAVVPLRSASDEQHYPRQQRPSTISDYQTDYTPPSPPPKHYEPPPSASYRPPIPLHGQYSEAPKQESSSHYRPSPPAQEYNGYDDRSRDQGAETKSHSGEGGGDVSAIPGDPDKDYPVMSKLPSTITFSCNNKLPGFYADVKHRCQVYYLCSQMGRVQSFLCPNGTVFNQISFVCEWWYNVDCSSSEKHFGRNSELYKVPLPPKEEYEAQEEPQYISRPENRQQKHSSTSHSRRPQVVVFKEPPATHSRDQGQYQQEISPAAPSGDEYRDYRQGEGAPVSHPHSYDDYHQPTAPQGNYNNYRQPTAPPPDSDYGNYHEAGAQPQAGYAPPEYGTYVSQQDDSVRQKTKRLRKRLRKVPKRE